jgi:hypothetical protein
MFRQIIFRGDVHFITLLDSNRGVTRRVSRDGFPFAAVEGGGGAAFGAFFSVDGFGFADLGTVEEDFDVNAAVVDTVLH